MKTGSLLIGVLLVGAPIAQGYCLAQERTGPDSRGITAVEGLEVGHHTLRERPTGCTVVLARHGAVAGVDIRGGAPGTREIALLDPARTRVIEVHAVVLSGGSAYGLEAASGVMTYLEDQGIGFAVGAGVVPIVPAAILYDLGVGGDPSIRPGSECGHLAASMASTEPPREGSVGAGAGATVGKFGGSNRSMKGGFGTSSITLDSGLTVAAAVAVNAVGDVVDPANGQVVAGVRTQDGRDLADARVILRSQEAERPLQDELGTNTTIGIVATNAVLTASEAAKFAEMAHDGLARTIYPAHTVGDGDTIFSLATGIWEGEVNLSLIGALGAEVMSEAILRAVRLAESLPGIPSVSDLNN